VELEKTQESPGKPVCEASYLCGPVETSSSSVRARIVGSSRHPIAALVAFCGFLETGGGVLVASGLFESLSSLSMAVRLSWCCGGHHSCWWDYNTTASIADYGGPCAPLKQRLLAMLDAQRSEKTARGGRAIFGSLTIS
jgi:hypothetical protein